MESVTLAHPIALDPLPQPQPADPFRRHRLLAAYGLAVALHVLAAGILAFSASGAGAAMAGLFAAEPTVSVELIEPPPKPPEEARPLEPPVVQEPAPREPVLQAPVPADPAPAPPPKVAEQPRPQPVQPEAPQAAAPPPAQTLPPTSPEPPPALSPPTPPPAPGVATVAPQDRVDPAAPPRPPGVNPGFGERPAISRPGAPVRMPDIALAGPEDWYDFDADAFAILLLPSTPAPPVSQQRPGTATAPSTLRMAPVNVQPGSYGAFQYPIAAQSNGLEGDVLLAVKVDTDGNVLAVSVVRSSGHPELDAAALSGMRRARFRVQQYTGPGKVAEAVSFEAPISFRLR